MKYLILVVVLAACGCYRATHLTREITIERDADGKIVKTIEREMVTQEIYAEGIKAEMLKGVSIRVPVPVSDSERNNPTGPWKK